MTPENDWVQQFIGRTLADPAEALELLAQLESNAESMAGDEAENVEPPFSYAPVV